MSHPYRKFVQDAFAKAIGAGPTARNAELSIVNWARDQVPYEDASWESPNFRLQYKAKAHSLLKEFERGTTTVVPNLRVDGDRVVFEYSLVPQLIRKLQLKELDSKKLAWYPAEILWPEGPMARAILKYRERDMYMERLKAQEQDYEGILQCRKCKSKKTEYYQLQTRSADEPMVRFFRYLFSQFSDALFQTTYATCKNCGNKWKC